MKDEKSKTSQKMIRHAQSDACACIPSCQTQKPATFLEGQRMSALTRLVITGSVCLEVTVYPRSTPPPSL
ncbi:hypothetical protein OUZ56_018317 [Daphnia magna]|uniref:Uncharacterized protein n=1 Tax=Daphnia magna TaxID=35525 RepID=A0ABQ9Z8I1_9CRUS|nr:hypothetical protein OUZ56_018317 [Daphnia magna]